MTQSPNPLLDRIILKAKIMLLQNSSIFIRHRLPWKKRKKGIRKKKKLFIEARTENILKNWPSIWSLNGGKMPLRLFMFFTAICGIFCWVRSPVRRKPKQIIYIYIYMIWQHFLITQIKKSKDGRFLLWCVQCLHSSFYKADFFMVNILNAECSASSVCVGFFMLPGSVRSATPNSIFLWHVKVFSRSVRLM